ncbi:Glycosyltransferase involved in cell wall bisynthesis [Mariniphaga anaerophila]|uniref:Glycosyltransferase involved in cell wall bisynthesis n=1 Tax=Mariniphaga anaerophila TaxID=1484053 RepID=A0A1M5FZJ0_9BACT|nr:glycosyltransferase [Mariniphaga anaerophila]SHF96582.1 Glycosyltransferase involved in cell wall bisynthesis [Mariniphaga anaerophila]
MKITILGPAHPLRGGIAALNERLAKQLVAEGHEVNIVSFSLQYPKLLFPGKTQFSDDNISFDFPVTQEVNSVNPLNWLKTGNKIKKYKPDLLIVRFWLPFMAMSLGTICGMVRKNGHTKIISIVDNIIPHEKRPGDKLLSNYFVNRVDAFIAMSKSVLNDLNLFDSAKQKKFSPHPIYDHYGNIESRETALQKLNLDAQFRYILFFGFIRDYKGLDLLLHAIANEYFDKNNIKLIVAGEFYADETKYLKLIDELNLRNKVILKTDYIPNSEVENYFNAADIVAQPYKSATQSGVTQIGYHFNKPMLVTDVGGLSEIISHGKAGYVVPPNVTEIKNALTDFFENNRANAFTQNTIKEKERFSWDKMTESILSLYKKL